MRLVSTMKTPLFELGVSALFYKLFALSSRKIDSSTTVSFVLVLQYFTVEQVSKLNFHNYSSITPPEDSKIKYYQIGLQVM
jgi:hypothetical protein